MERNRYYTGDEINSIIEQAKRVCGAWMAAPPFRIAKEVAALREALDLDGNGHKPEKDHVVLDDELMCKIGGD